MDAFIRWFACRMPFDGCFTKTKNFKIIRRLSSPFFFLQKKTSPKGLALFICLDIFRNEFQQLLSSHIQSFTIFTTESQMRIDLTSKDTIFF